MVLLCLWLPVGCSLQLSIQARAALPLSFRAGILANLPCAECARAGENRRSLALSCAWRAGDCVGVASGALLRERVPRVLLTCAAALSRKTSLGWKRCALKHGIHSFSRLTE